MNQALIAKNTLFQIIRSMAAFPAPYVLNPDKDFTRNRILDFFTTMRFTLSMQASPLKKELLDFFDYQADTVSPSALIQQRKKIRLKAFYHLLYQFNQAFLSSSYRGHQLLACDGSVLNVPLDHVPGNEAYSYSKRETQKDYYQLHINALYDLCNYCYTDLIIHPRKGHHEVQGLCEMLERRDFTPGSILIADRGYEAYRLFAQIEQKELFYLFRVKDGNTGGIVKGFPLPKEKDAQFDETFTRIFTWRKNEYIRTHPELYKIVTHGNSPYFLNKERPQFKMTLRIVRFEVSPGIYECVITNLPKKEFPPQELKELYRMRWGIETSFRELKYAIGLSNLHSKKVELIQQEILARVILYNYCEIVIAAVIVEKKGTKYQYQVNHTMAIHICRNFLKGHFQGAPPDVETLIAKELLPIRPNRSFPRKVSYHPAVKFNYRVV